MAHPELENIFGRRTLLAAADVPVQIDETREHVVTLELHHFVARTRDRPALFFDRNTGKADALDLRDAVVLDHDVHRADSGGARAVDQSDGSQDETVERTVSSGAGRCYRNGVVRLVDLSPSVP